MAKQSPGAVYAQLRAAGFSAPRAVLMTAVAGAESGWDDTARGDLSLQDSTWGPSFGLYQIRTLKSATGSGADRDVTWLANSPANQAQAAFDISAGGSDLTPWSAYVNGAYAKYLSAAQGAAGDATTTPASLGGLLGGDDLLGGLRNLAVGLGFGLLGLALVGGGLALAVKGRGR